MIKKIETRYPNLECGFFAALCTIERFRRHLGITRGKLKWGFTSTYQPYVSRPEEGTVRFNCGGGRWDQHVQPENQRLGLLQTCSIDLVQGDYDFLSHRPWLKALYLRVRKNDLRGTRISKHRFNIRALMSGLTDLYPDDPQIVLDWLSMAFSGVFTGIKNGRRIEDALGPAEILQAVKVSNPDQADWFEQMMCQAREAILMAEEEGERAGLAAVRTGFCREVTLAGQTVKVISVCTDSFLAASVARSHGYHLIIQRNSNGLVQIQGGTLHVKDANGQTKQKIRLDLAPLAEVVRREEMRLAGLRPDGEADYQAVGYAYATDGSSVPWYFPQFRTALYNGTKSSPNVPPTRINATSLLDICVSTVCQCQPQIQDNDGNWILGEFDRLSMIA